MARPCRRLFVLKAVGGRAPAGRGDFRLPSSIVIPSCLWVDGVGTILFSLVDTIKQVQKITKAVETSRSALDRLEFTTSSV